MSDPVHATPRPQALTVESITGPESPPSTKPDDFSKEELKHHKEMHDLDRKSYEQDIKDRKKYADHLFRLVSWWLVVIIYVVISSAWKESLFHPSDSVVLALIGGTTVSVVGLFLVVAKYLFHPWAMKTKGKEQNDRH